MAETFMQDLDRSLAEARAAFSRSDSLDVDRLARAIHAVGKAGRPNPEDRYLELNSDELAVEIADEYIRDDPRPEGLDS
jgi:hypothetical protein